MPSAVSGMSHLVKWIPLGRNTPRQGKEDVHSITSAGFEAAMSEDTKLQSLTPEEVPCTLHLGTKGRSAKKARRRASPSHHRVGRP